MMLKLYFNKKALETVAKEIRRASWGAAAASAAVGYQSTSGIATLLGAGSWIILQVFAFVLESIRNERGDEK
jgi:hypothetical protein